MGLKDLIAQELGNKDFAHLDIERLFEVAKGTPYIRLTYGLFLPNVGVMGDWSKEEKDVVRAIIDARTQAHSLGHVFGKAMTGYDDPNVEKHKDAYQIIEEMRPGDIAKVRVNQQEYFVAMFPDKMPSIGLVLFVK